VRRIEKVLKRHEIEQLYQHVNTGRRWAIDVKSHDLIDEIIRLWFEQQGYDFWQNPYPEVVEWSISKENEITFVYIIEENAKG